MAIKDHLGKMSLGESTSSSSSRIDQIAATNNGSNNSRTSLIGSEASNKPIGISAVGLCFQFNSQQNKRTFHKVLVLLLTFIAYAAFHMGRRPLSVVKNVLNKNCSTPLPNHTHTTFNELSTSSSSPSLSTYQLNPQENQFNVEANITNNSSSSCDSWAPFDDDTTANQLLATLDSSFLLSYALFMFVSGIVAERMNLRYFISIGTIFSGLGLIAFGLGYPLKIHSMTYFVMVQIISGAAQTTGWPAVVTCVGNWFGPAKRGLIFGLWNSHTSLGNILGAVLAGVFVEYDWGLSFIVPGVIMIAVGILLFLFLVPRPQDVHLSSLGDKLAAQQIHNTQPISGYQNFGDLGESSAGSIEESKSKIQEDKEQQQQQQQQRKHQQHKAVSFFTALKIPGVIEYSLCLFFSKLVSYTFLYWLPRYIKSSTTNNSENSAYLSTPFDIGGVAGGILAGYFSDKFNANGITCTIMLISAIPSMFLYQKYGPYSSLNNIALQLLVGVLVNGPYSLITTAVSADLGTRIKDGRAMATVAAIIDGMGSIGAVLGPLFAGFASQSDDWQAVFIMLMLADVLASICLLRVTVNEFKNRFSKSVVESI